MMGLAGTCVGKGSITSALEPAGMGRGRPALFPGEKFTREPYLSSGSLDRLPQASYKGNKLNEEKEREGGILPLDFF